MYITEEEIYYKHGAVIELMDIKLLIIHPSNIENNIQALEKGDLYLNWFEAFKSYKKFSITQNYEIKITIYGKLMSAVKFGNIETFYTFLRQLDNGHIKIPWANLLELAKDENYAPPTIPFTNDDIWYNINNLKGWNEVKP